MTVAEVARLRALCAAASPGPWCAWNAYGCAGGTHPMDAECVHVARLGPAEVAERTGIVADGGRGDLNGHLADFEFIVAARSALPDLLDAYEAALRLAEENQK